MAIGIRRYAVGAVAANVAVQHRTCVLCVYSNTSIPQRQTSVSNGCVQLNSCLIQPDYSIADLSADQVNASIRVLEGNARRHDGIGLAANSVPIVERRGTVTYRGVDCVNPEINIMK